MDGWYVWETRRRGPADAMAERFAATMKEHHASFFVARRFVQPIPELEVQFHAPNDCVIGDDFLIRKRRCLLHSERLAEVLWRAGVRSIDYHGCRLTNTFNGIIHRTHQAANLLDMIHCMDRVQSDLEVDDEEPNEIWYIHRLALIKDRLGDSPMFRLGERRDTVIVHESVKRAVEQAGMHGPVFLPASGYREYMGEPKDRNVIGTHDLDPDGPADGKSGTGGNDPAGEAAESGDGVA